jgi:hypothetical protein
LSAGGAAGVGYEYVKTHSSSLLQSSDSGRDSSEHLILAGVGGSANGRVGISIPLVVWGAPSTPTATETIASSTPNQALSTPPVENTSTSTTPVQTGAAATTTTASSSSGASPLKLGVSAGVMPAVPSGSVIGTRHRDWNIVRSGIAKGLRHYELVYGANKETVRLEAMTVAGMGDPILQTRSAASRNSRDPGKCNGHERPPSCRHPFLARRRRPKRTKLTSAPAVSPPPLIHNGSHRLAAVEAARRFGRFAAQLSH